MAWWWRDGVYIKSAEILGHWGSEHLMRTDDMSRVTYADVIKHLNDADKVMYKMIRNTIKRGSCNMSRNTTIFTSLVLDSDSLRSHAVFSESLLGILCLVKDPNIHL